MKVAFVLPLFCFSFKKKNFFIICFKDGIINRESSASESLDDLVDENEEIMPLLYVRQHKKRSFLKRMIDTLMSWFVEYKSFFGHVFYKFGNREKRGAVEAYSKVERRRRRDEDDEMDDEKDLDCFGRQDDRHEFDWIHFGLDEKGKLCVC